MIQFAIWFQNTALSTATRDSSYAFPIILTLHVTFISLFGAMILATDLRLLGWGFREHKVSEIVNQLRWPKRIGFLLVATCGVLVLGTKAEEYFLNPFFQLKVALLVLVAVHAIVFRGTVYNKAAELDAQPEMPPRAKLAGALSLLLWVSIACAGRSIGYIYAPPNSHHFTSMVFPARQSEEIRLLRAGGDDPGIRRFDEDCIMMREYGQATASVGGMVQVLLDSIDDTYPLIRPRLPVPARNR